MIGRGSDKALAVNLGRQLREYLLPKVTGPIKFVKSVIAEASDTDGWACEIANYGNVTIEVWYDRFARAAQRSFWFGFHSEARRPIQLLINRCPKLLKPKIILRDTDVTNGSGFRALRRSLSGNDAAHPIHEKCNPGDTFFGLYDLRNPEVIDLQRASDFLLDALRPDLEIAIDEAVDDYQSIENRKFVSVHLRRERDPELAKRCKQRDNYRCQICEITFEEVYGDLGYAFAEAHHIVPLSHLNGPATTRLEDLITVCANCHRMLHKLPGRQSDICALKRQCRIATDRSKETNIASTPL